MSIWRRARLATGIYDEVISRHVSAQLRALPDGPHVVREPIGATEDVAGPIGALLREGLDIALAETVGRPEASIALATAVLRTLQTHAPKAFPREDELRFEHERLRAIVAPPAESVARPRGSLLTSRLLVNAEGESLLDHLRTEFESADRVDLLCSFVKLSGFEKLRRELERHALRGRPLRVLTTTYMGASDAKAVERLAQLPHAAVKVSYDEQATRLHAKAWVFHRRSGLSTAYVGSSNLSHAAQTDGLEWNLRITQTDQPAVLAQMQETFEQYWEDPHQFEHFDARSESHRARLVRALAPERRASNDDTLFEIEPKDYQKPILEELATARRLGRHRNLVVAATGTGKTVLAALDYRALRAAGAVDSLLFVAHRQEILTQARRVFRSALQSREFGELLYDGERPTAGRHVFASIDSLGEGGPVDASSFDMVILDEAHHAAADSWERLLARVAPKELVGLTGTPERADGLEFERYFPSPWVGNLRVWDAIPHALVPFRYYALDVEGVDLSEVEWRAGRYAQKELSGKLVGAAEVFVRRAVRAVAEYVARRDELRAIAFCVDVRHAREVAERFTAEGFKTSVLTGETPRAERTSARRDLDGGRTQVLCVVDIYNEGVDVPNVNTLFFFRPTESATVFLQQLGRGLRRAPTKSELVVFDLTGRQHREFRFDRRLRALLGSSPRELAETVKTGFGRLPTGCLVHFDEVAQEDVLDQLRRAIPHDAAGIGRLLRDERHRGLTLAGFLRETDVELSDIYRKDRSWHGLRRANGLDARELTEGEEAAMKNVHKLLHVGDERRIESWLSLLSGVRPGTESERRLACMLAVVLYGKDARIDASGELPWARHRVLCEELGELLPVLRARNALLAEPHELSAEIPLALHARYLGVELSAAFDHRTKEGAFRDYYTGVEKTDGGRYDLLLVTLAKSEATKEHLKYRDFPLNERRFHWQSKARTTRQSAEGRRHLAPEREGCTPLLFVRERSDERPGVTMAFRYLGPVRPDGDTGERPITIEWEVEHAMPHDLVQRGRIAV